MAITAGSVLNSTPAAGQQALASNYLDLATTANQGWAQQYLPDLMEKEAEVFGNRTISGFLSQVGAEEAMSADQVVWSEQGRLHLSYVGTVTKLGDTNGQFTVVSDIDGNIAADGFTPASHGIRVNDIVIIATSGVVTKCLVVEAPVGAGNDTVTVEPYTASDLAAHAETASGSILLVVGSEYGKGQSYSDETGTHNSDRREAIEPTFKSFTNKPIIMKDYYEISGSDASQFVC